MKDTLKQLGWTHSVCNSCGGNIDKYKKGDILIKYWRRNNTWRIQLPGAQHAGAGESQLMDKLKTINLI